jgi:mRNA-degrading endonuclease RelE of RelBE toxin-antitoxin system
MSDKKAKFIKKLSGKEKQRVLEALDDIMKNNIADLDVKKLVGWDYYYRVRIGRVRIIFRSIDGANEVIHITWRDEQTYRGF